MFFCQYASFPCQYHSTNAPYAFIHLPPTLYNVFLSVRQFLLSVSFHQCSIFIHSTLYNVFLSVRQFLLSVSFHQCSIFIHSTLYNVFLSVRQFPLSVSFHQCSIFFTLKLFLPERQQAAILKSSNAFFGNRGRLAKKALSLLSRNFRVTEFSFHRKRS